MGKVFICYHKEDEIIENEVLTPISLNSNVNHLNFCLSKDNSGENIADYNYTFSELTALYWMWKNTEYDFVGLFHYRRLLFMKEIMEFSQLKGDLITISGVYENYDKFGLDRRNIESLMEKYDFILPEIEHLPISVYEQYKYFPSHVLEHLDTAVKYIEENQPEMMDVVNETLEGNKMFFCNMFIAKKQLIDEYCEWVFPILFHIIEKVPEQGLNRQQLRYAGFVSERLFYIFISYIQQKKPIKIKYFKQIYIDSKAHSTALQNLLKTQQEVAIFGTGIAAQDVLSIIKSKVKVLIDNDVSKQNTTLEGIHITSVDDYLKNHRYPILICSSYYKEISEQLNNMGLELDKDYYIMDLGYLI